METKFMFAAIEEAKIASIEEEVPVGCIIVKDGEIIGKAHNRREQLNQATAHAEILAINEACKKIDSWRLDGCDLYVTLEPCLMCSGAIMQSRIENVYFGADDPKGGMCGTCANFTDIKGFNHYPNIKGGVMKEECSELLKNFFKKRRENK